MTQKSPFFLLKPLEACLIINTSRHLQRRRKNLLTPSLKPPKTQWKTNGQNSLVLEIVWDNENPSSLGDWHYPMELDARSSNFSAIHFNDKSESRVISKAPKLVETRNRDDTRNRNLCLSPEILSKNLVTSTTTFPTNLCEIYVKMKSSFTFNGNTEIWSNRSFFGVRTEWPFFGHFVFSTSAIHSNLLKNFAAIHFWPKKKRSVFFSFFFNSSGAVTSSLKATQRFRPCFFAEISQLFVRKDVPTYPGT